MTHDSDGNPSRSSKTLPRRVLLTTGSALVGGAVGATTAFSHHRSDHFRGQVSSHRQPEQEETTTTGYGESDYGANGYGL